MKKLLNTLYVTRQDVYLRKDGESIVIEKDRTAISRMPVHNLSGIVTFGNVMISPWLMSHCAEHGVCISMLTEHGKFLARVEGPISGNVHLRIAQVRAYEDCEKKADLARGFVIGKLYNARMIMMRRLRDHGPCEHIERAVERHASLIRRLRDEHLAVESVRGIEGDAAAAYFSAFNEMIVSQRDEFLFAGRNRRPPRDPMNALLSYLYTLLAHDCRGALESVGLDPQVGYLHELRPGRPSLALDLMEELRPVLADRVALSLVNLKQVSARSFHSSETGAMEMDENSRRIVLTVWQKKKQEEIVHPFLDEKIQIGLIPQVQAMLLSRYLRGDQDAYPPFLLK